MVSETCPWSVTRAVFAAALDLVAAMWVITRDLLLGVLRGRLEFHELERR